MLPRNRLHFPALIHVDAQNGWHGKLVDGPLWRNGSKRLLCSHQFVAFIETANINLWKINENIHTYIQFIYLLLFFSFILTKKILNNEVKVNKGNENVYVCVSVLFCFFYFLFFLERDVGTKWWFILYKFTWLHIF